MKEYSDPYENAIAEWINGILKQVFLIDTYHLYLLVMKQVVAAVIDTNKKERPH